MSSGLTRKRQRLAGWRAALPYAGYGAKKALRGMIAALEAELNSPDAPGAFARESAEAMQTGLPCRVRSFASAGSDPGGQVPDVAAAPYPAAGGDPDVAGNAAGQPDPDWHEHRQALRRAGHEVKQFDGVLYVDGLRADRIANPELFP